MCLSWTRNDKDVSHKSFKLNNTGDQIESYCVIEETLLIPRMTGSLKILTIGKARGILMMRDLY